MAAKDSAWPHFNFRTHPVHWYPHVEFSLKGVKSHIPFVQSKPCPDASTVHSIDSATTTCAACEARDHQRSPLEQPHHRQWPFSFLHSPAPPNMCLSTCSYGASANVMATHDFYIIEMEVPGLHTQDRDKVSVEWMSPRTVTIIADIPSNRAIAPMLVDLTSDGTVTNDMETDHQDGGEVRRVFTHEDAYPLIEERHRGVSRRSFTLPEDAFTGLDPSSGVGSTGKLRWEVNAGLLTVAVPRRRMEQSRADDSTSH